MRITQEMLDKWVVLAQLDDTFLSPKLTKKQKKNALRFIVQENIHPSCIRIIVDNTVLRNTKQGIVITESDLYAYSGFFGRHRISLNEINSVEYQVRRPLKAYAPGYLINNEFFVAFPGMLGTSELLGVELDKPLVLLAALHDLLDFELIAP